MTRTPQPDFLHPVRGPHVLSRVACGVALLVLGLAALDALDAWQSRAEALARRDAPWPQSPAAVPAQSEAGRAVQQALVALDRPWPGVFEAVEASTVPGVAWLALDVGERGAFRLEGIAPDAARALAAAEALRAQGRWSEVLVARMDRSADGLQRFALIATPAGGAW